MFTRCVAVYAVAAAIAFGADVTGIWQGQQASRNGQVEDIAFRFKVQNESLTGRMFGDEFDIAIEEGTLTGDQLRFTITTTNYYNGSRTKFIYTGVVKGGEMEVTRERVPAPEDRPANRVPVKQTLKLKKLT